jgi:YesN/AraC family two-component response regulator
MSISKNVIHAYKNGLINTLKGEDHQNSKLKKENIIEIFKLFSDGISMIEIGKKFKISDRYVAKILQRKA